jgi:putative dimethyl sulfoxide reductase chaperone
MRKLVFEVNGLEGVEEVRASARSQLYLLFSDGFHVPDEEFYADVTSGKFREWIQDAMERLAYKFDGKESVELLNAPVDYQEFNAEFMRLFEVGVGAPNCPLNESQYIGGPATIFEELVRFYNFFDLSAAEARELPDHLRIELDFMHFLTFKEAERLHSGMDAGSFVRAERDFLQRHLSKWVPLVHQKVDQFAQLDFFKGLTRSLDGFIGCESALLRESAENSA